MSYQEKFWLLFSKKLSNEATIDELLELESLIQEHPEWQYAIQNLEDLWNHQVEKDTSHEEDAYLLHIHRMQESGVPFGELPDEVPAKRKKTQLKWYLSAAAVLLIGGFFLFGGFISVKKEEGEIARQVSEISTRPGSKSKVELPDGSVVWLNAGSKLTYNKDFGKVKREVTLVGEGYFDVTKNKEKPFIISTASINIKVLGTVFNVKAYQEDKLTETSLIHGSIEVTIKNRPKDKIILSPNEKLVVENNMVAATAKHADKVSGQIERTPIPDISTLMSVNKLTYNPADSSIAETAWVNNRLVIRDESFEEMLVKMERWYNVDIELNNERLARERITVTFENETIEQALEALKLATPFRYERIQNRIIINNK